ncbi:MAG: pyruvate, phosphate dikinase [Armatimonadetes bacterium]|nr:pyruvate, phosphate dikinase [Armatimonadota bacterium]
MASKKSQKKNQVWLFREGNAKLRDLLGGKGANLAEMTNIGLPVPPGFTITTEVCNDYIKGGKRLPADLMNEVKKALANVEKSMEKKLGDPTHPLLVSVRSGAKFSMPGMMDTILNLGLNDATAQSIIDATGNERFVWDAYRRLVMMFSDVVLGVEKEEFEKIFDHMKKRLGVKNDTEVDAENMKKLTQLFRDHTKKRLGREFPTDPMEQLQLAISSVFDSWDNERAKEYRRTEKISDDLGTAVNVQTMVFGNMGDDSGTGVAFTRNPSTGEKKLFGEYLMNAQGEDVVAGVRTPVDINELAKQSPEIYQQFEEACATLENHYREVQDIEFTIEKGHLYFLQCRSGKRTGPAAIKIAVDLVNEGLISKEEALLRVPPEQLEQCLHPRLKERPASRAVAKGMNAGPGAAGGHIVLDSATSVRRGKKGAGEKVILVRRQTNPDDLGGMLSSEGVLTSEGGRTSHAALVARQFGIPTICGCSEIAIDLKNRTVTTKSGTVLNEGDWITIDGTEGIVYTGQLRTEPPSITGEFKVFMDWADTFRRLKVRANADTPEQATEAITWGAQGIGLCRTEHMFLGDRLPKIQKVILADSDKSRQKALDELLPLQRGDFIGIFKAMGDRPVTIRLVDPPMHEFLIDIEQKTREEVMILRLTKPGSKVLAQKEKLLTKIESHHESNPMLGMRGCRLSIVFPQIVEMQVAAIIGAGCRVKKKGGNPHVEIMIPLVGVDKELSILRKQLDNVSKATMEAEKVNINYSFGTMIEVPRAALTAHEIAKEAAFFSFGTNDLTQLTYGISRDDAGTFLPIYIAKKIIPEDPTLSIDATGVGRLMKICVTEAREVNPKIKIGICGEHGGDPRSVVFCDSIGMDYVSCSPRRVPVARLAAAQAALGADERDK